MSHLWAYCTVSLSRPVCSHVCVARTFENTGRQNKSVWDTNLLISLTLFTVETAPRFIPDVINTWIARPVEVWRWNLIRNELPSVSDLYKGFLNRSILFKVTVLQIFVIKIVHSSRIYFDHAIRSLLRIFIHTLINSIPTNNTKLRFPGKCPNWSHAFFGTW